MCVHAQYVYTEYLSLRDKHVWTVTVGFIALHITTLCVGRKFYYLAQGHTRNLLLSAGLHPGDPTPGPA